MFIFATRRLLAAIPIILIATFSTYWGASLVTDPRDNLATCQNCSDQAYQRLIDLYDLDTPVPPTVSFEDGVSVNPGRYLKWLGNFVTGDMGASTSQGERPVSEIFWERGRNTLLLALPAFFLLTILGTLTGVYSALKQYSLGDYGITSISYLGLAMPTFFFGLLLQVVFAIWLPKYVGFKPFWSSGMHLESPLQFLRSVTLPVMTLMFVLLAGDSRFIRAAVLDLKTADFIRTARAKGLSERKVISKHLFRNAMIPAITLWSLNAAALFGGSLITETIFSWPGFGRLLISATFAADLNLVMAIVFAITVLVVLMNLLADILYGVLDPRIRYD